ncbi:hypothetical protein D7B24_004532 [Verticillium nonalfalfae]|uniref:Uncharacterized protein n=1 Tax=Verticillium nonalfalfae TaxID=1051616 RepID=A0A3M9XUU4_9PEZI|nr:uncharacterized protein D7B24_004532 [Verticillium nonalfalfae]RNJ52053.1 hypothetical protein D7B24_004532 [Verticillium nonalfalfae]
MPEVAVLDMRRQSFTTHPQEWLGSKHYEVVQLPRWRASKDVRLPSKSGNGEYIATVHTWKLGLGYNMNRFMGQSKQLYVLTK